MRKQEHMDKKAVLRLCRVFRAHYWDLTTGKSIAFDRTTMDFVPEEPCAKCEQKVQVGIEKLNAANIIRREQR